MGRQRQPAALLLLRAARDPRGRSVAGGEHLRHERAAPDLPHGAGDRVPAGEPLPPLRGGPPGDRHRGRHPRDPGAVRARHGPPHR